MGRIYTYSDVRISLNTEIHRILKGVSKCYSIAASENLRHLEDSMKLLKWARIRNGYLVQLSRKHVNMITSWSSPEASLWLPW